MTETIAGLPVAIVRHPRARRIKLSFARGGAGLRLSIPPRASAARALEWARGQQQWVATRAATRPETPPLGPGSTLPLFGEPVSLAHVESARRRVERGADRVTVHCPRERLAPTLLAWLRGVARDTLSADTEDFATRAGVRVTGVAIGDPRSRWGSCSATGAIRYSWRLILAPPWVRRATVAHEVAHRLHMDHSPAFHTALAGLAETDPRVARAWLRAHGAELHQFGAE